MKSKNMTLMIIAIGCGLVAAVLTAKLSGGNAVDMADVIVAKKELPVGTLLDEKELENMVGLAKFPKSTLPPDIVLSAEDLKGKKLNRTLKPGNFFSAGDISADNGIKLPEGMYKYTIKTDVVKSAYGSVQPGDHVDVSLTESLPNGKARAGFVLRDVLVLAVDTRQQRTERGEAVNQVNGVSLAVTPEQSLYLSAAERRGEVKLVLRDSQDTNRKDVAPILAIPGIDEKNNQAVAATATVKNVTIVVAKSDVPLNTLVTEDNFNMFFELRDVPEQGLSSKVLKDRDSLRGKYITRAIESDMPVFANWLSATAVEAEKPPAVAMVEPDPLEVLPPPRTVVSLYPRKFEQIINNQRIWFMETSPGEFRRVDAPDVKDLPESGASAPEKKEEKKQDDGRGDRAA